MKRPCTKKDAPAKQRADKTTLYSPIEAEVMPAPTSTRPEEREFTVDSRASMHMMSKKESSSEEIWKVKKRSRTPTVVLTATGEVQTHEEAQVFVHDLTSVRNRATTRGNACSPIIGKTLRRPRILL